MLFAVPLWAASFLSQGILAAHRSDASLSKYERLAASVQGLEAEKASNPFEEGETLESVAAVHNPRDGTRGLLRLATQRAPAAARFRSGFAGRCFAALNLVARKYLRPARPAC